MSEVEIRVFNSNGQIVLTEVGSEYSILNLEGFKKGGLFNCDVWRS